ncbi:MAG TPA: hypothetical protein VGL61_06450 [Kofleriaceae bacterium]|jgi:hypothetical protein
MNLAQLIVSDNVSETPPPTEGVTDLAALMVAHRKIKQALAELDPVNEAAIASRVHLHNSRYKVGLALLDARKAWPERGPSAAGWGKYLAHVGLNERTALRWMDLAAGKKPARKLLANDELEAKLEAKLDSIHHVCRLVEGDEAKERAIALLRRKADQMEKDLASTRAVRAEYEEHVAQHAAHCSAAGTAAPAPA